MTLKMTARFPDPSSVKIEALGEELVRRGFERMLGFEDDVPLYVRVLTDGRMFTPSFTTVVRLKTDRWPVNNWNIEMVILGTTREEIEAAYYLACNFLASYKD